MAEKQVPTRNLAMELVRVTEAAALAAARWVGGGDKEAADGAAVDAMRVVLDTVPMDGVVIIGEGEKDEAPMLYNGERIGDGSPPEADIAVDPIDGTTLTSLGRGNAIAVIAVSERGTMYDPGPCVYMEKIAAGPEAADVIDITATPTENLNAVAKANRCRMVVANLRGGRVLATMVGFETDVRHTRSLYLSLSHQAVRFMLASPLPPGDTPRRFRHSFLLAYAYRIGERLEEAETQAMTEAEAEQLAHPNALSTKGHPEGLMSFRWFLSDDLPEHPATQVVPVAQAPVIVS